MKPVNEREPWGGLLPLPEESSLTLGRERGGRVGAHPVPLQFLAAWPQDLWSQISRA